MEGLLTESQLEIFRQKFFNGNAPAVAVHSPTAADGGANGAAFQGIDSYVLAHQVHLLSHADWSEGRGSVAGDGTDRVSDPWTIGSSDPICDPSAPPPPPPGTGHWWEAPMDVSARSKGEASAQPFHSCSVTEKENEKHFT